MATKYLYEVSYQKDVLYFGMKFDSMKGYKLRPNRYDTMVVCAESESEARSFHPQLGRVSPWKHTTDWIKYEDRQELTVMRLGIADASITLGVILARQLDDTHDY